MSDSTDRPRLSDLFAPRARQVALPSFGAEIPGPVPLVTSFSFGLADPQFFPRSALAQAAAIAVQDDDALNYGSTHEGLINRVVQIMARRGIPTTPEQVLISYGSGEILALLPQVFVDPGDVVIVEGPTFMGAASRFVAGGARVISIPVDDQGMDVVALDQVLQNLAQQGIRPRFIYTIPTFHNPKGSTLSLERRHHLMRLAVYYGVLIVEDDAYFDLRFSGDPLPPLAALDPEGWVLYVSTFSKIIAPGLRVGWAAGSPEILRRLEMFRAEGSVGRFLGRTIDQFCDQERLERYVQLLCKAYEHKCKTMLQQIRLHFPVEVQVMPPQGGFFLWCQLPSEISATALLQRTRAQGVTFLPGSRCFADGSGDDAMRLAFSYQPPEQIKTGIEVIGAALKEMMA